MHQPHPIKSPVSVLIIPLRTNPSSQNPSLLSMSSRRLPLPSPRFSRDEASRAVDALLGFLRAQEKLRKAQLFEHDDLIYLHLNVRRIPAYSRLIPHRIPLPHTLHPLDRSRTSLCLITDDSLADAARSRAASENLPFDSVISLSELRADYVPYEARRRLCDSYDIFFANRRIMHLLPRLMGNYFFRKKKMPLFVDISRSGWPEAIRHVCRCTLLYFSTGTCSVLKVGRVSMDREEIIDNLMAAIEGAIELIPKKWANVRSMYIKAVQSVALPIYQALPVMGMKIDVAPVGKEDPFDGVSDQKRVKEMGEEGKNKRKGGSKKRKGRIHDVDYMGAGVDDGGEEEDVAGELVGKKTKKDGKNKVNKSKKAKTTGDEDHGGKEKGSSGEFFELGNEKKLKKAKKVLDSEEQDDDKTDGSDVANDGADVMITDDAFAATDDNQDDIKLPAKKRVKKNEKRGKDKKSKKVDEEKATNKGGVGGMKKKAKSMKSEDVNLKVKKSKKAKTTGDENCGVKEKGSSGEFIELGKEEKKMKKADGSDVANEGADVMNTDDAFAAADDNQDDIKLPAMKRVKDNGKRSKDKKKKKADEERANNKRGDGGMKKGKSMKSEDMNLKKMKVKKTKST